MPMLLTCVQVHVIAKVGLLRESSVADVAFEGPRPGVDVHVRLEVSRSREALRAECALMWLFLKHTEKLVAVQCARCKRVIAAN